MSPTASLAYLGKMTDAVMGLQQGGLDLVTSPSRTLQRISPTCM